MEELFKSKTRVGMVWLNQRILEKIAGVLGTGETLIATAACQGDWSGPLVVTHPSLELQLLIYYNQQPLFFDQLCSRSWYFDLGFDVDCVFCSTQVTKAISKRNNQREQRHKRLLCPGMSKSTVQCFTADKDLKYCKYINIHVLPWSIREYRGSALRRKLGFCFNTSVFSVQCCNNAQERSETKGRQKLHVHFHRG